MEFQVLGRVGYRCGSEWMHPRGALRQRMLGVLLARAGQVVSFDLLAGAMWPGTADGGDDRTQSRLHLHAHRLRRALDRPDRLVVDHHGYLLRVEPDELDAGRFERLAGRALATDPGVPQRADLAREGLGQWPDPWNGAAYPGLDVPLLADEAERLATLRLDLTEVLFDAEIRRGRHLDVLADLQRVATEHPLREPLQVHLMRALHQAGRPAEALAVYARTREQLVEELGLEPSEDLRRVQDFVLSGQGPETPGGASTVPLGGPDQAGRHPEGIRPAPAQLPPSVPLVGREVALADLDRALAPGRARHAVITGLPGVGKSAVAVSWATEHRGDFPDGQLFVDLQGYGPTPSASVDAVLDRFIRALGGSVTGLQDTEERITTYRSHVAGRRVLVLLDNARDAEQVRPLLPPERGCLSLVTSRDHLGGVLARENAHHLALRPLQPDDGVTLLRSLSGDPEAADRDALRRVADRCAGLPVALRVAALRLRQDTVPTGLDPATRAGGSGDVLDWLDLGDPMASARTVFSWSVEALGPRELHLFTALGVTRGDRVDVGGLAALTDTDVGTTRAAVEGLVRANLAQLHDGWVDQHDLLAVYARERAEDVGPAEREQMQHRLLAYYLAQVEAVDALGGSDREQSRFQSVREANQWLDSAAEPLVAEVEQAPPSADEEVTGLSHILGGNALTGRGRPDLAQRLHRSAVLVAERRGDLGAAATAMQSLARITGKLGDHEEAVEQWERARSLALASGDPARLAVVHNNYTNLLMFRGQFLRSWGHLAVARRRCEDAGDAARGRTIRSNVGLILLLLERYQQAEAVLRELLAESGSPDSRAFSLRNLVMLELRRGRLEEAEPLLLEAITLAEQRSNHVLRSELGGLLGQLRFRQGDAEAAHELLLQSLEEAIEQREQADRVVCLIGLARVEGAADPSQALARAEEGLARARREQLRELEFRAMLVMSDIFDQVGQEDRAAGVRELAGSIRQDCGLPAEQAHEAW